MKGIALAWTRRFTNFLKKEDSLGAGESVVPLSLGTTHPPGPSYTESKHGVVGLTKAAALEYRRFGIRVNAVCPGLIHTPMIERAADTKLGQDLPPQWRPMGGVLKAMQKLGIRAVAPSQKAARRLGEPGEVAEAVAWLCSDAASFVNGHAMAIDGGYLAK